MGLPIFAREDQCRTPIALDHTSGANTDYAAMPSFGFQDQAVGILQLGRALDFLVDLLDNPLLFLLPIAVQLVELHRHLSGLSSVLLGEQLDHTLGNIHPTRSVQSRR